MNKTQIIEQLNQLQETMRILKFNVHDSKYKENPFSLQWNRTESVIRIPMIESDILTFEKEKIKLANLALKLAEKYEKQLLKDLKKLI